MKKLFAILLVSLCSMAMIEPAEAQGPKTKYHGEVYVSGGYGVGDAQLHRLQLHTIQGARIGECFSMGVGLGVDWYTNDIESGMAMIPIFADLKLYAPTRGNFDPYLMVDLGYGFAAEEPQLGGLMFGAGIGFKAGIFNMSIGYHLQQLGIQGLSIGMSAIQLKLGVAF